MPWTSTPPPVRRSRWACCGAARRARCLSTGASLRLSSNRVAGSVKRVAVVSALPAVRAGLRALVEAGGAYEVSAEAASPAQLTPPAGDDRPPLHGTLASAASLRTDGAAGADVLVVDADPGLDARDVALAASSAGGVVVLGALEDEERLPALLGRPFA